MQKLLLWPGNSIKKSRIKITRKSIDNNSQVLSIKHFKIQIFIQKIFTMFTPLTLNILNFSLYFLVQNCHSNDTIQYLLFNIMSSKKDNQMSNKKTWQNNKFTVFISIIRDSIFYGFLGGPRIIKMRHIINVFKGLTLFYVLSLMYYFQNFSNALKLYLIIHGSYGFFWVFKDVFFPDVRFFEKQTIASSIILTAFLVLYWTIPLPLAIGWSSYELQLPRTVLIVCMYVLGLILMMGSDYQKNTVLKYKKGIISDKFFSITRNPNYLGQVFIYLSFAICANHWIGYSIDLFAWFVLFNIQMYLKDKTSYEMKQGWKDYYAKTYRFFPKLFNNHLLNFLFYSIIISTLCIIQFSQYLPLEYTKLLSLNDSL